MGTERTDEFRKDAVRIALTSGLTRWQVADDLPPCMPAVFNHINQDRGHIHSAHFKQSRAAALIERRGRLAG